MMSLKRCRILWATLKASLSLVLVKNQECTVSRRYHQTLGEFPTYISYLQYILDS